MSPRPLRPATPLSTRSMAAALLTVTTLAALVACGEDSTATEPGIPREYGSAQALGNGQVRSYVIKSNDGKPLEVGVALTEAAMEGLPAPMSTPMPGHADMHEYILALPANHGTPYKFIELDWNPGGHEPPGIYDSPHFDLHFYTITKAERDQIDPAGPNYAQNARFAPDAIYARPFFVNAAVAANAPAEAVAVPKMGVHWLDTKSPELQGLVGNPAGYKPFTSTYIHGAWAGKFIFDEPMITRAHILARKTATDTAQRNLVIPVPTPARATPAGYYPAAYRIQYDATAREYRLALTNLGYKE